MIDNVTLTQLRAFAAVAQARSYTQAAAALNYSPPAVHQQIRALERALGFVLVQRRSSSLSLTPDGEELLPSVDLLLERAAAFSQLARNLRSPGRVSIGGGRNTGVFLLMPILARLAEESPDLEVDFHIMRADELVEQVIAGSIDVAVSGKMQYSLDAEARRTHQLVLTPWTHDLPVVVARAGASCSGLGTNGMRVFLPPYAEFDIEAWKQHPRVEIAGAERWQFVEMETADAAKSAAANGLGLAVLPYSAVRQEVLGGQLAVVASVSERPQPVHLLHRRPRLLSEGPRRAIRMLLAHRPR